MKSSNEALKSESGEKKLHIHGFSLVLKFPLPGTFKKLSPLFIREIKIFLIIIHINILISVLLKLSIYCFLNMAPICGYINPQIKETQKEKYFYKLENPSPHICRKI